MDGIRKSSKRGQTSVLRSSEILKKIQSKLYGADTMFKLTFTFLLVIMLACTCFASSLAEEHESLEQDDDIESSEVSKEEGWCCFYLLS